tara:strand:- start:1698 stop:5927 length:4230 start_codon:yes stop_codon:yes gene_type:complete
MTSFKTITSEGGLGYIPLNWADNVPKYDPSSFYNWEQDNMPLWNLEDRTNSLYASQGYPGGNPLGVTFTLSSAGSVDQSKGIYDSIADIVERIPKRLKFPVLIEICTYGNLGKLELANITCEGDGILEVRNQAYFEHVDASAYNVTNVSSSPAGAASLISNVYSLDASAIMMDVSASRGGTKFFDQDSWNSNAHIITTVGPDTDRQFSNITCHVGSGTGTYNNLGAGNYGQFQLYPWNAVQDRSISSTAGDAMAFWGSSTASAMQETTKYTGGLYKREGQITGGQATLFGYGSWFSEVALKDCQGSIVLRNILTDGSNDRNDTEGPQGHIHQKTHGFDIENSEVILDNTTAMFAVKSGYSVKNSRIKITGHCVGWRNYTKTGLNPNTRTQDGTGFLGLNSDILWDETAYTNSRKYLNYFGKSKRGMDLRNCTVRGGISWGTDVPTFTGGTAEEVSALPNGGSQQQPGTYTSPYGMNLTTVSGVGGDTLTTTINVANCNEDGIYMEGTDFEFKGRINTFLNVGNGVRANRSQVRVPQITSNNNSAHGIRLESSNFTYGFNLDTFYHRPDRYTRTMFTKNLNGAGTSTFWEPLRIRNRANFHVDSNNQNIVVTNNSTLSAERMNNIPKFFGKWGGCDWVHTNSYADGRSYADEVSGLPATHFGATPFRIQNKPGIIATNNSTVELVNSVYTVDSRDAGKGRIGIASNGSNLTFRGTSGCATTQNYYPVNNTSQQFRSWISNGVMGTDNAVVELTGPTKSARFGVPFLVEDSSQLLIKPPTLEGTDNILDVSGYTLLNNARNLQSSSNHTSLHVHSTRACLVANRNSGIQFYGLGGKVVGDPTGTYAQDSVDVLATDYASSYLQNANNQFTMCTSGGHVKFYPNAFTSGVAADGALAPRISLNSVGSPLNPSKYYILPAEEHDAATTGGMCVRAVGDSYIDANLVNWHHYTQPHNVSGAFYSLNGAGCEAGTDTGYNSGDDDDGTEVPGPDDIVDIPGGAIGVDDDGNLGGGETGSDENEWSTGRLHDNATTNKVGNTSDQLGLGSLYSPVGAGSKSTLSAAFGGTTNPGSPAVIGDERAWGFKQGVYGWSSNDNAQTDALQEELTCMGSRIHIWNVADTSRIHASNCLINNGDPEVYCIGNSEVVPPIVGAGYHGPFGKWWNGVSLDYYGRGGRRTTYGALGNSNYNAGVYRLILSTRGDLKSYYDVSTLSGTVSNPSPGGDGSYKGSSFSGGSFVDQINGQGYTHWTQNVRTLANSDQLRKVGTDSDYIQGLYQTSGALRVFGWGHPSNLFDRGVATMQNRLCGFSSYNVVSGGTGDPDNSWIYTTAEPEFPIPPINMDWQGYMRNWFDQTASNVWQNAKHLSEDKVNGCSIYRSYQSGDSGGEGRDAPATFTYGVGVRSLNLFDMDRLL